MNIILTASSEASVNSKSMQLILLLYHPYIDVSGRKDNGCSIICCEFGLKYVWESWFCKGLDNRALSIRNSVVLLHFLMIQFCCLR